MSVRVNFEIGHEASIRTKATPEGFTHDWNVFVRGSDSHNIGHFVEKVVFYLHETFPKPKRVVKEPPFTVKESGYAGFVIPIEVYLKNKDEPKKIKFSYDLTLHQTGPDTYNLMNEQHVFQNPNEDFRKKLLKGGGFITNHTSYGSHEERNSRDSFTDEKPQLISKPKLSGDAAKKHKPKEHRYDLPRPSNSFVNLFGPPIQKASKVSPDPKKTAPPPPPPAPPKVEKKEKDKSSSDKDKQNSKHEHKEKRREEKDKAKEERRSHKEAEKTKEKSSKRPNERPPSPAPTPPKKRCPSPPRRPPSPPSKPNGSADVKPIKTVEPEKKNIKVEPPEVKEKEKEKKSKKEKKSHDKEKERSKKDHKKENHKSTKEIPKELPKEPSKPKEFEIKKEKEPPAEPPQLVKEKPPKQDKPFNKFSIENMLKKPEPQKHEEPKQKEKGESERKHKHKKKDKKREESREKHKDSKKHKHDKQVKEPPPEPKDTPILKQETPKPVELDRPIKIEPASPISIDTSSQCSSKSGIISKARNSVGLDDISATSHSDSDSGPDDEEDSKYKNKQPSRPPDPPVKVDPKPPTPAPEPERPVERNERQQTMPSDPPPQKEKSKKHKDKSKRAEGDEKKKRKRKSSTKPDEVDSKVIKMDTKKPEGPAGGSKPPKAETKPPDNGVTSSVGEELEEASGASDAEPRRDPTPEAGDLSPDYMLRLKELQQRIMTIKSNEELERVVNLIAETGRYEVTTQTFDFDLCLLDRSTVQRLIELIR